MLNLIRCECAKLRRRRLFQLAVATASFFPLALSLFFARNTETFVRVQSTAYQFTGFLLQIPLLAVLAMQLLFEEADCGALKNLLVVPVPRAALCGAKLLMLLAFSVAYSLVGFGVCAAISLMRGLPMDGWGAHLFVSVEFGALCFFAAMPCIALLVWLNKSAVVCVLLTFFYTIVNYGLGTNGLIICVPLGLNVGSLLPVAVMQRFINAYFGFNSYYERIRPYLISPWTALAILSVEAAVCYLIAWRGYRRLAA